MGHRLRARLTPRPKEKKRPTKPLSFALPVEEVDLECVVVEVDDEVVEVDPEQRRANQEEAAEYRAKRRRRVQADMYIRSMCCH